MARGKSPGCCVTLLMYATLTASLLVYYYKILNPPPVTPRPRDPFISVHTFHPRECNPIPNTESAMHAAAVKAKELTLLAIEHNENMLTPYHIGERDCYFVANVAAANQKPVYAAFFNPQRQADRYFVRVAHRNRLCGHLPLKHRFPKYMKWAWTNPVTLALAVNETSDLRLSTELATAFHLLEGGNICMP